MLYIANSVVSNLNEQDTKRWNPLNFMKIKTNHDSCIFLFFILFLHLFFILTIALAVGQTVVPKHNRYICFISTSFIWWTGKYDWFSSFSLMSCFLPLLPQNWFSVWPVAAVARVSWDSQVPDPTAKLQITQTSRLEMRKCSTLHLQLCNCFRRNIIG